jgi:hypothetical protein
MKYLTFLDYPTLEATGRSFEAKLNVVVDQKDKQIRELENKIAELTNERPEQIDHLTQEIEKLKAATRDHIGTQVKEESSSPSQRIDKTVLRFMREHTEYFEEKRIGE